MKPFDHHKFLGYVAEVTPGYIRVQMPSALHLTSFYHQGEVYNGGNVGGFVVVEGPEFGFLGRLFELTLTQVERQAITEQNLQQSEQTFHPVAKVELLALFSVYTPEKIIKTVSRYPAIGAKVFSCSNEQIGHYIETFGVKEETISGAPFVPLGKLTSNSQECQVSLDSLFGRHCAVLGTTGGGKSWTVAKLVELYTEHTQNKCILVDATGEYSEVGNQHVSIQMGTGEYIFDYKNLTVDEMFYLLHPSAKTQVPKLMEAIRSLKMVELDNNNELILYYEQHPTDGTKFFKTNLIKANKAKRTLHSFYYKHITDIEDRSCRFNFNYLAKQITQECIWDTDVHNSNNYGGRNENDVSNCVSLISRVNNISSTSEYNRIFGFRRDKIQGEPKDLTAAIDTFLQSDMSCLRIDFSQVSFDYQVREILVNAIGKYLLNKARDNKFKESPLVIFIDEAHQFLNKAIADEYFAAKPLDAFEQISKEARKYGLFLCIATQMPRDIPLGTLSQMGTFIVHRLINEQDKKAVESAASAANRNSLAYLPILGEGEALLVGVDFPMPLTLRINEPKHKPNSNTPKFKKKEEQ
ncbi:MAG: ATP-binding protein [Bacteroidales bacterium]|nr:ATP-binding protein [Bacteroidales bacterium]